MRVPRDDPTRSGLARLRNEQAALQFLSAIGSTLAPRFIAGNASAGLLVTEDLGAAPSLLDLLLGDDREAVCQGLLAFARGLGTLHAQTAGRASAYAVRRAQLGPTDPEAEDAAVRLDVAASWRQVQGAVAQLRLPRPCGVDHDVAAVVHTLATPGAYLALSSGDPSPINCTIAQGTARFFDFEGATFRHALIDASVLRYLYPTGGPPWRLPRDLAYSIELAYREALAPACPDVRAAAYDGGLVAASAAWTILRMVRLPKVEAGPDRTPWLLVPPGWSAPLPTRSRRRQLVAIIETFIVSARRAGLFAALTVWCDNVVAALRARWPEASEEMPLYPAFL